MPLPTPSQRPSATVTERVKAPGSDTRSRVRIRGRGFESTRGSGKCFLWLQNCPGPKDMKNSSFGFQLSYVCQMCIYFSFIALIPCRPVYSNMLSSPWSLLCSHVATCHRSYGAELLLYGSINVRLFAHTASGHSFGSRWESETWSVLRVEFSWITDDRITRNI